MANERTQQENISRASSGRTEAYNTNSYISRYSKAYEFEKLKNEASIQSLLTLRKENEEIEKKLRYAQEVVRLKEEEKIFTEKAVTDAQKNNESTNELLKQQKEINKAIKDGSKHLATLAQEQEIYERALNAVTASMQEQGTLELASGAAELHAHDEKLKNLQDELSLINRIIDSEYTSTEAKIAAQKRLQEIQMDEGITESDRKTLFGSEENISRGAGFITAFKQSLDGAKGEFTGLIGKPLDGIAKYAGAILDAVLSMRASLNKMVDSAASFLENVYGAINANLEGTDKTYDSIANSMKDAIGLSGVIKQTDYLNTIKNLTNQGLNRELEQMATIDILKDRTLTTFDTLDANLIRIQKLQTFGANNTTALMFGVENVIKNRFNELYEDTTYLSSLYDAVTGMVTDALSEVKNNGDAVSLYSAIQSWMGTLYEAGVSSGTVDKLAQGINYLGSGNISALSSSKDIENLLLLAMDKAGMDFADTLQQGLSADDVNLLFSTLTEYLKDVYNKTTENNVLTSAYTNLFGMSVSDIKAISNIKSIGALNVSQEQALAAAASELGLAGSTDRTLLSQRLNNFVENAQFDFGEQIASSTGAYATYKLSNMLLDVADTFDSLAGKNKNGVSSGPLAKLATATKWAGTLGYLGTTGYGALGLAQALGGAINNLGPNYDSILTLAGLQGTQTPGAISGGISAIEGLLGNAIGTYEQHTDNSGSGTKFTSTYTTASGEVIDMSNWENESDAEDETTKILKELENTLMQCTTNDGESKYAIAVSLQGMSDDVLRSFASIFADEEAMSDTFSGKNNVLKDALFKFADDGTTAAKNK